MKQKKSFLLILVMSLNIVTLVAQTFSNPQLKVSPQPMRAPSQSVPVVYGTVIANMQEDESQYGLYSISTAKNSKLTKVQGAPSEIIANGGGICLDGVYRFVNYDIWTEKTTYYEYDTKTWKQLKKEVLPDKTNIGIDEAYDPTTGNTYGCFTDASGESYVFGFVDHDTHRRTYISTPSVLFFAVAVSPEGEVYAIGSDGVLYKVDKTTGKQTKIGDTGIMPKYYQSAVFDMNSGKMYWAACTTSGSSGLYEVNTQTGKATIINAFPSKEQVTGLYIPFERAKADAPAEVTNLSAMFADASLSGKLSFTMPIRTYAGGDLSGNHTYKVILNGVQYATNAAQPGEEVVIDVTGVEGINTISVCAQNENGSGPISKLQKWLGYDAPVMTQPSLAYDGDKTLTLSWEKPTSSMHGGYLDADGIRYNIVRYPGALTIATNYAKNTLSQRLSPKQYTKYYYTLQAVSHSQTSDEMQSNAIGFGKAYAIPFTEDFSSTYTDYFNREGDWLITPALDTSAQNVYAITVDASNAGISDATVELYMGDGCGAKDMTQKLGGKTIKAGATAQLKAYMHSNATNGSFVGIRTTGDATVSLLSIVRQTTAEAPDTVRQLKTECAEGSNDVKVSFIAPTTTVSGNPLSAISNVKILAGSNVVGTLSNVSPGKACEFTHTDAPDGWQDYTVYAVSDKGDGMPAISSVFVGTDIPLAPTDVKVIDANGTPHITWTAPIKGVNGEYVNPEKLSYDVMRNDNSIVATDISGTSFDDTSLDLTSSSQSFCQYAVRAKSTGGVGSYGMSNAIVKGVPYTIPFYESFPSGTLSYNFWATEGSGGKWSVTTSTSSDGDGGSILFTPSSAGADMSLYSGKIDVKDQKSIHLSYDCYATPGADTKLLVELRRPDTTVETVDALDMATLDGEKGWQKRFVNVPVSSDYCHVMFRVLSNDGTTKVYVDNISVGNTVDYDLDAQISAPSEAKAGSNALIKAMMRNVGTKPYEDSFTVNLIADGETVGSQTLQGLALGASSTCEFDYPLSPFSVGSHKLRIELSAAADENTANNSSSEATLKVVATSLPVVENLTTTAVAGGSKLTWSAPDLVGEVSVTDDVESYEPFAIDGIGDWTMVDVDGSRTYGIASGSSYVAFPHALDPKSWIVFNAPESGAQIYDNAGNPTAWMPHSGNQMFVSFQDSDGATDDWMISPELPGYAQTISFFVRSINPSKHGFETFEVLYSTTDKSLDSFRQITSVNGEAPADWTEISAELPEGTKYFAIRGTSAGHFALLLDDITYSVMDKSQLHLRGYNVYVDKKQVNDEPIAATEYVVENGQNARRVDVAAVYDEGLSAPVGISLTDGISTVSSGKATISVCDGTLRIANLSGCAYSIYTTAGQLVSAGKGKESVSISLKKGIYLVKTGDKNSKITIQ